MSNSILNYLFVTVHFQMLIFGLKKKKKKKKFKCRYGTSIYTNVKCFPYYTHQSSITQLARDQSRSKTQVSIKTTLSRPTSGSGTTSVPGPIHCQGQN